MFGPVQPGPFPPRRTTPPLAQPLPPQALTRTTPEPRHTFAGATGWMHPVSVGPATDADALASTSSRSRAWGAGERLAAAPGGAGHRRARPACGSGDAGARFRCGTRKALAPSCLRTKLRVGPPPSYRRHSCRPYRRHSCRQASRAACGFGTPRSGSPGRLRDLAGGLRRERARPPDEVLLPRQGPGLVQPGAALDLVGSSFPGVPLLVGRPFYGPVVTAR